MLPLRPPHALMVFYTLAGTLGLPLSVTGPDLIAPVDGVAVFDRMLTLAALLDPACAGMDPIAAFEAMAETGATVACAPLIYGYVTYAIPGFRPHRLTFTDIPFVGKAGPIGSALGGTGIAVSAFSPARAAAVDFAYWIASAEVQGGLYAQSGGQPGHAAAWQDAVINAKTGNFYSGSRATLEGAWVRPRHHGYMKFQTEAAELMTESIFARRAADAVVAEVNRLFRDSF